MCRFLFKPYNQPRGSAYQGVNSTAARRTKRISAEIQKLLHKGAAHEFLAAFAVQTGIQIDLLFGNRPSYLVLDTLLVRPKWQGENKPREVARNDNKSSAFIHSVFILNFRADPPMYHTNFNAISSFDAFL
jgi:hypothetical protein